MALKKIPLRFDAKPQFDWTKNRPYFCVFKYARAVKQKVWIEAEAPACETPKLR